MGHSAGPHLGPSCSPILVFKPLKTLAQDLHLAVLVLPDLMVLVGWKTASTKDVFAFANNIDGARLLRNFSGGEPPMMFLHGLRDRTVSPSATSDFSNKIKEMHGFSQAILYPKEGHISPELSLAWPLRFMNSVHGDIARSLRDIC